MILWIAANQKLENVVHQDPIHACQSHRCSQPDGMKQLEVQWGLLLTRESRQEEAYAPLESDCFDNDPKPVAVDAVVAAADVQVVSVVHPLGGREVLSVAGWCFQLDPLS